MNLLRFSTFLFFLFFFSNCGTSIFEAADDDLPYNTDFVFAIIGDYGNDSDEEGEVADMVKSWSPDFIITLGDNNYSDGELETIQENIGQYYCDYIYNPDAPEALRCTGAAASDKVNRFFPSLGNHDVHEDDGAPYLLYFTLPDNERYYTFRKGHIQFFVLDSTIDEDELECCDNEQAQWLQDALASSDAKFKIVYFHHPPYSTGKHGSEEVMQWHFEDWGAHAVLSGHDHVYQRIHKKNRPDFPYFVCGVSGKSNESCGDEDLEDENSFDLICIDDVHGAMKVITRKDELHFQFYSIEAPGNILDEFVLRPLP